MIYSPQDFFSVREASRIIAASNSIDKSKADYVCDGVSDQVEINQAIADLSGGGRIILLDGQFNISSSIIINQARLAIEGQGKSTKFYLVDNSNCDVIKVTAFGSSGIDLKLQDFWIHGNKANQTGGNGISADAYAAGSYNERMTIKNILIQDAKESCFFITRLFKGTVSGCWASNAGKHGFDLSRAEVSAIIDCKSWGNVIHGFYLDGISRISCLGLISHNNGYNGIRVDSAGVFDSSFIGCRTYMNGDYGLRIVAGQRPHIIGCTLEETAYALLNGATNLMAIGNRIVSYTGAGSSKFRGNIGLVTENSGEATVTSGSTSVVVTHGLSLTPTAKDIMVTPTADLGGAKKFWISSVGATTFTINVDAAPGADITFAWQAQIL